MSLFCLGVSHHTAAVGVRERVALGRDAVRRLLTTGLGAPVAEFAVLATCNRTEFYARAAPDCRPDDAFDRMLAALQAVAGAGDAELAAHCYRWRGVDVVRHLCRVAAGLDSMLVGEFEILGQVVGAHTLAMECGSVDAVLDTAFQTAVRAGRRARAETAIARLPTSVGSEAVRLLRDLAAPLASRRVLIIGTGKMGRLAAETLRAEGVGALAVISRTAQHAEELAGHVGALALPWHELPAALAAADAVLCSTGAPHAVVTRELVEGAIGRAGDGRRRHFIDIAVPRDVEPAVGDLPGIVLVDIDALEPRVRANIDQRRIAVPAVERIIDREVAQFAAWRRGDRLRPVLAGMRARAEAIRQREMQRALARLGDVSPGLREQLEAFSRSLVNKVLDEPTRRLRDGESAA